MLRIYKILQTQLYIDEVYDLYWSQGTSIKDFLMYRYWNLQHPPYFYIFLKYLQQISFSPFFLRAPGVATSFFSLILLIFLARADMNPKNCTTT